MKDDFDKPKLSKRIKRYASVGKVVGKFVTKIAGEKYLGLSYNNKNNAKSLKNALGTIKGPLMKVAQLTATIPDILPPEYAKELAELQSNAPPMGWMFVNRRMSNELGSNWLKYFSSFSKEASKALKPIKIPLK